MSKNVYMQLCDALGSTVELRIVSEDADTVEAVFKNLWQNVFDFEKRFSRFRSESELSVFNDTAGTKTPISPQFRELLLKVQYFGKVSHGVFNPFILPNLERAGYKASMTESASAMTQYSSRKLVDVESLQVGSTWALIPHDTALDFGGIGKGYLADSLAHTLSTCTDSYCLSLGGDMRVSGEQPTGSWVIDVESGNTTDASIGTYTHSSSSSYGIATSGIVRTKKGKQQHHQINPHTGMPALSSYRTCTVVASDAVSADVFASCILIEGVDLAHRLFTEHYVKAVLLQGDAHTAPLVLGTGFEYLTTFDTVTKTSGHAQT